MKAARILQFGSASVIANADIPRPEPRPGQLLVQVKAAGVGPWDALIREGKSAIPQPLPLTLGSELSGIVEAIGPGPRPVNWSAHNGVKQRSARRHIDTKSSAQDSN